MAEIVIRGARVVGGETAVDVVVRDGVIASVGFASGADETGVDEASEVIDAAGMLLIPGMVDAHRHTWQTAWRQLGSAWSLTDYLTRLLGDVGARFRPDDVYAGTLLGSLTALDAGVTTIVDWSHIQNGPEHADAAVQALADAGIRAVFAHGWAPGRIGDERHPDDIRRVRSDLLPDDDALITLAMGARGPDLAGIQSSIADFRLARELGLPITAHVAGGAPMANSVGIWQLHRADLLGDDLTLVHVNGADDDALRLLADHGVGVAISPQIELTMPQMGAAVPLRRMRRAGVRVGLSVDSETSATGDLFSQMRFALASDRAATPDGESPLRADEVLEMATAGGAAVAGLAGRVGALRPGMAADLTLIRGTDVNMAPARDASAAIVLSAHPGNVDTVMVNGRIVKRHGRLVADLRRAQALAEASLAHLQQSVVPSETAA